MIKTLSRWVLRDEISQQVSREAELIEANGEKNREIDRLTAELMGKDLLLGKKVAIVEASVGDPEPQGKERPGYVMEVSNFYDSIGKKKLMHLIAITRETLDSVHDSFPAGIHTRTEYDSFLRGTSNAFKMFIDWFELLQGEHKTNINNQGAQGADNE